MKIEINGYEAMPIKDFIAKYHPQVSVPAIKNAADTGRIDTYQPARDVFVLITPKTLEYKPRYYAAVHGQLK